MYQENATNAVGCSHSAGLSLHVAFTPPPVEAAESIPEGITFSNPKSYPEYHSEPGAYYEYFDTEANETVTVSQDVSLDDFRMYFLENGNPKLVIEKNATLSITGYNTTDEQGIGIDVKNGSHLSIEGGGTLQIKIDDAANTTETTAQRGSAIYVSPWDLNTTVVPSDFSDAATVTVDNVNLELIGDFGIRVDDNSKLTVGSAESPTDHVYIGVERRDGELVASNSSMNKGISVGDGGSTVDIHTKDFKVYSQGSRESEAYLIVTTPNFDSATPAKIKKELAAQYGPATVNINADTMDLQAFGGKQKNGVAIYAYAEDTTKSAINLSGGTFSLKTDWQYGIFSNAYYYDTDMGVPGATLNMNFSDSINVVAAGNGIEAQGASTVNMQARNISVSGTGESKRAVYALYGGAINLEAKTIDLQADNGYVAYAYYGGASIDMVADTLNARSANGGLAYAQNNTTINMNYDTASDGLLAGKVSHLQGQIDSYYGSMVNIGLGTADSWLIGSTCDGSYRNMSWLGGINIHAGNGATWYVRRYGGTDDSELYSYVSEGLSHVDLTTETKGQNLNITNLSGHNAEFILRTVVDENRTGTDRDHVNILSGSGNHTISVKASGTDSQLDQTDYLVKHYELDGAKSIRLDTQGAEAEGIEANTVTARTREAVMEPLSFSLSNRGGAVDIGNYQYTLMTRDFTDEPDEDQTEGASGTEWFLRRTNAPSSGRDMADALPAASVPLTLWWAQLEDLRKRLGEVREDGTREGLWARFITWEDDMKGIGGAGFHQKAYGLNIGLDRIYKEDEDGMWLLGGNWRATQATQDFDTVGGGHGRSHSFGVNLYATWADKKKGYYADFVLTADHLSQKMETTQSDWTKVKGRYGTYGLGASVEVGRKMEGEAQDGWGDWKHNWFVEPQAQLAYYWVKGKDYRLDNGMTVKQDNGESITGRLGVVIGKKNHDEKTMKVRDKNFSQVYLEGGVKQEMAGAQKVRVNGQTFSDKLGGTRWYYGAGFDWNVSKRSRLYAQIEKENGNKYDRDYYFTIGLKYDY